MKLFLILATTILAISCTSKSGQRRKQTELIQLPSAIQVFNDPKICDTVQVLHPDGWVENVPNTKHFMVNVNDTVIVHDYYQKLSDTTSISERILWGFKKGKSPEPWYDDDLGVVSEFFTVIVLRKW